MSFVDGLSSGLDTTTIIKQLMDIERRPQVALTNRRTAAQSARTELSGIRSDVTGLRDLAKNLRLPTGWDTLKVASSNPDAVTVKAGSAAATGSYSFQVTSLATAASVYSTNTIASTSSVIAPAGASVFTASGHQALGFASLTGSGFAPGDIAFEVLQSSTEARLDGVVGIPAVPIEIDGTNDGIDVAVNGFNFTVTLAHNTYSSEAALATAVSDAIAATQGASEVMTAKLNDANQISLATKGEGSANSITITGGSALTALGLTAGTTATGTDGIVSLNGTDTLVTNTTSGTQITLATSGAGSIDAVMGGPLRPGTATVAQTSLGGGTLNEVVNVVNRANLGYTAAAVNTGRGYRLQLTAKQTGAASAITPDTNIFGSMAFTVLSQGTDAELTIQGANPFSIKSSTNTFSGLVPGVDVTVNATTTTAVTISTERDYDAVTTKVAELVTKLNDTLSRIAKSTVNEPGAARSVLQGSREARRAGDALRGALVAPVDGSSLTSLGMVGIELTREGTLTFDQAKFTEALKTNQTEVTKLFADRTASGNLGALDRLIGAADGAASVSNGYLYTAAEASSRRMEDYGRQIDTYERRLGLREASLRKTYANLEVALNSLQKQSANLASQLGGGRS